jgi:hypothetical protein
MVSMDKHWSDHLRNLCKDTHHSEYRLPYPECREGWKGLLVNLIININKLGIPWSAGQIKEKWGTLRFYADVHNLEEEESWVQKVSKPDYRMTAFDETVMSFINKPQEEKRNLTEQFSELISDAEHESAKICEICSKPGKIRNLSWAQTLCEVCYQQAR